MDFASTVVTVDRNGVFHVNQYQDAAVTLDGVRFEIAGNYPVGTTVTVRVSQPVKLAFRKPAWCPKMEVSSHGDVHTLVFDMNPRLVNRTIPDDPSAMENFYLHQTVQGLDASPMDLAALVESVTADQVVEIANGVELDAVYFLKGEDRE